MSIVLHIENYLGKVDCGWKDNTTASEIQVVKFDNQPFDGASTYATIGMSNKTLELTETKKIKQELIFSTYSTFSDEQIASFLLTLSEYIVSKNQGILRGDVIGPSAPLISGVKVDCIYSAIPVIFDDDFSTYNGSDPATVLVWIIPIFNNELEFVRQFGWNDFEDLLETKNPDLWDLNRQSIV